MRCHAFGCDAPDALDPEAYVSLAGMPAHPGCVDDDTTEDD